jgi:hypothetical protein
LFVLAHLLCDEQAHSKSNSPKEANMSSSIRFPRIHASIKASRAQRVNTETKQDNGIVTLTTANEAFLCRNPGLSRLVNPEITVPIIESPGDPQWQEYLQSRTDVLDSLQSSFFAARALRDNYRNWLCKKLDESWTPEFGYTGCETLIDEIESLYASDAGYNSWDARPDVADLEYGVITNIPRWKDMGWTVPEKDVWGSPNPDRKTDAPKEAAEDTIVVPSDDILAEGGIDLFAVREQRFDNKAKAQAFVDSIRKSFKAGDRSTEVITCSVDKGSSSPFVATILEADGNWGHRKALSAERDKHVKVAIQRIKACETRQQLLSIVKIVKRYSRDMQCINAGNSHDGGRCKSTQIGSDIKTRKPIMEHARLGRRCGFGFNYIRFATVMNAIADQAKNLKLDGFKRYPINEFETTRKPVDGDMLDVGCKQGEFLALEIAAEHTPESLWMQQEKTWKAGREYTPPRLFIAPPSTTDVLAWQMGLNVAFAA